MDIPVYLIAGFLDAGKTNFINGVLQDGFAREDRTLLICCEEGEEAYYPSALSNVFTTTPMKYLPAGVWKRLKSSARRKSAGFSLRWMAATTA